MNSLDSLLSSASHFTVTTPRGATVLVLNTGAEITAEDTAMLMSLHSRSPAGILEHLQKLKKSGSGKLMSQFYVGYGHKSIGDCGSTHIFIEGVSMLAAKAIQDSMLYSGQECSTRYIDFSQQPFFDSVDDSYSHKILRELRNFYVESFPKVVAHVKSSYPKQDDEDESVYNRSVNARAFDILRGFLPAGATTNVAWHTNLRQAADRLLQLRHHPLGEVVDIADALETVLQQAYPHSFNHKRYEKTEQYVREWMKQGYLYDPSTHPYDTVLVHNGIDHTLLQSFESVMSERPPKTELPKSVGMCGTMRFEFQLDFGSYRDLQRQRAVVQRMPLLSTHYGFEDWYLDQLPDPLRKQARELLFGTKMAVRRLQISLEDQQYYVPMGYLCPCSLSGDIPALVYLVELRATPAVHPTLQVRAKQMAEIMSGEFKQFGLELHIDQGLTGRFDTARGNQTIFEKQTA